MSDSLVLSVMGWICAACAGWIVRRKSYGMATFIGLVSIGSYIISTKS